jgi:hypothetical protein
MRLQQPDRRSCGAAALVMARRLAHAPYAGLVADQETFAREATTLHRRITSLADTAGGWQVPWPRALGTPPWAVARELRLLTGVDYGVRVVRLRRRVWPHLGDTTARRPAAVFVGDRWLPRHVVLVTGTVDDDAMTYEPSSGLTRAVSRARWERGDLRLAGWDRPWLVVGPSGPAP